MVESFIVKIIETKLVKPNKLDIWRLNFPTKVDFCISNNLINEGIGEFLKKLNNLRNRYGHYLGYKISYEEAYRLAVEAGNVDIEFTDDFDKDKNFAIKYYTKELILSEIFRNTCNELDLILHDFGGEMLLV